MLGDKKQRAERVKTNFFQFQVGLEELSFFESFQRLVEVQEFADSSGSKTLTASFLGDEHHHHTVGRFFWEAKGAESSPHRAR